MLCLDKPQSNYTDFVYKVILKSAYFHTPGWKSTFISFYCLKQAVSNVFI